MLESSAPIPRELFVKIRWRLLELLPHALKRFRRRGWKSGLIAAILSGRDVLGGLHWDILSLLEQAPGLFR